MRPFSSREADRIASAAEISKAAHIPKGFLAKILQRLAKRGIVRSTKGAAGGFALSKSAEEVCVFEVIEALQGPCAINACAVDKNACDLSAVLHHASHVGRVETGNRRKAQT